MLRRLNIVTKSRLISILFHRKISCRSMATIKIDPSLLELERTRKQRFLMENRVDKLKRKASILINHSEIQVIGSNYHGFRPLVMVHSGGKSYLFNCREGTQRFCYSNKISLLPIEDIFITHLSWENIAGIIGLSLTTSEMGSPGFTVHSTPEIEKFWTSAYTFITHGAGNYRTKIISEGTIECKGMTIRPIILGSLHRSRLEKYSSNSDLIAYVCSLPGSPGELDPAKCRELKVPIGPQLGLLKMGKDIVLEDGAVVKSVDVLGPSKPGTQFLILDCPSLPYLDKVVESDYLKKIRNLRRPENDDQIDLIVHMSSDDVTSSSPYQKWMDGFAPSCKHVFVSNMESNPGDLSGPLSLNYLLNELDKDIFPPLDLLQELKIKLNSNYQNEDSGKSQTLYSNSKTPNYKLFDLDEYSKVIKLQSLDSITIRPHKNVSRAIPQTQLDVIHKSALLQPGYEEELKKLRDIQKDLPRPKNYEPEIVFLGTGSAQPAKYRNVSCILVNLHHPKKVSVMMDCGEDSYGQLCRFYGKDKSDEILKQLKLIYVSHHHADHHSGLMRLLTVRQSLTKEKIVLLVPPTLDELFNYHNRHLMDLSHTCEVFYTNTLKTNPSTGLTKTATSSLLKPKFLEYFKGIIEDVTIVGVVHCTHSCAVMFRFKIGHPEMDTFSIAYSGDARPSADFIVGSQNCDLLIHEGTFDFNSQLDARIKFHSTSTEAIQVGKDMNAKFTILTHFSQKMQKVPHFTGDYDEKVGFTYDFLSIRYPSQMQRLPILKPILSVIFKDSLDEYRRNYDKITSRKRLFDQMLDAEQD